MWIESVIDGHWFQAKVGSSATKTGVNGGKVFKLIVSASDRWVEFNQECVCYNWDRSLDFDNAPPGLIGKIVEYCEGHTS